MRSRLGVFVAVGALLAGAPNLAAQVAGARALSDAGGEVLPRHMTPAERAVWEANPPIIDRGPGAAPVGPIHCVAEYEPMESLIISWEGGTSLTNILAQIGRHVTTTGDGDLHVAADNATVQNNARTALLSAGADLNRVRYVVRTMDSIWMRDYGPRYIYEGDCRAIVDHVYNRPRPNDNTFPIAFAAAKHHARYDLPLVHGGGNYHLEALNGGYATRLIVNENGGRTEQQIRELWQQYQGVETLLFDPFPTSVDATQHIDMWMQVIGDRAVVISDWPNNAGSTQDNICDAAAATMAGRGFTVHRIPARSISGTHYTYTNVVMFNDLVIVPSYTNSTVSPHNAAALAVWQAALPTKTIVQLNAQSIVGLAGVFHCIVMHVPPPRGGVNPTAHLRTHRGGDALNAGQASTIQWITDDDVWVANVDILLSTDGGASYPITIAAATTDDGSFTWTVPALSTQRARLRLVARDADGNTGQTESPADFAISRPAAACPPDLNDDGTVNLSDLSALLAAFGTCLGQAGHLPAADINGDGCVTLADLSALLAAFGGDC